MLYSYTKILILIAVKNIPIVLQCLQWLELACILHLHGSGGCSWLIGSEDRFARLPAISSYYILTQPLKTIILSPASLFNWLLETTVVLGWQTRLNPHPYCIHRLYGLFRITLSLSSK